MKLLNVVAGLAGVAGAVEINAPLFGSQETAARRIPTSYESAVMGRRILALTKLGTMSTVFQAGSSAAHHRKHADDEKRAGALRRRRPEGFDGVPIGMPEYIADCEDHGNPTILALKIATSFKNIEAGSNVSLLVQWVPPYPPTKRISLLSRLTAYVPFMSHKAYNESPGEESGFAAPPDTVPYSAANLPRFSLFGHVEPIDADDADAARLAKCYTTKHPDAKYWLPGNRIHTSEWVRFVVTDVYWLGGFGDRAYIGWITEEEWKSVTKEEWQSIELPGEKEGWSEWNDDDL